MGGLSSFTSDLIFKLIAIVLGLSVHEFGHAAMALLVGDDTAKKQGRVTLNPLAHLDVLGLLIIFIASFGWAKPVIFDPRRICINKRLGIVLIALAGPLMNAVLALVAIGAFYALNPLPGTFWASGIGIFVFKALSWILQLNIALAIFNLIPIPPLDGWMILHYSLPRRFFPQMSRFERIGPFFLILLLITPVGSYVLSYTVMAVMSWFGLA